MSATGRGERLGGEFDVYPTPTWAVHRLLDRLAPITLRPGLWAEPCAGYGAVIRAVASHPRTSSVRWHACEIRPEVERLLADSLERARSWPPVIGDFLKLGVHINVRRECSVVLTNPPFSLAEEFWRRCREAMPGATIAFLLRCGFIGGEERLGWLGEQMPDVYQLPNRPSFVGGGASNDSTEYAWMVWEPLPRGAFRRRGHIEILEPTPIEVRRRDKEEAAALLRGVEFVERDVQLVLGGLG